MNKLDYALKYAKLGIRVFPITPDTKTPAIKSWPDEATTDPTLIKRWWAIDADYNIGIATGRGVVAIDADTKDGKPGLSSLELLDLEVIPTSLRSRTPSGGVHVLLKTDRQIHNRVNSIAEYPGIDIRGENGYILAAGSTLPNGSYTLTANGKIEDMPAEFAEILAKRPKHKAKTDEPVIDLDTEENIAKAVDWLTNTAATAIEGEGGDETTYRTAARLRDYGLSQPIALDVMLGHWNERNEPPWPPEDLQTKVENAFMYASGTWGGSSPAADFESVDLDVGEKPDFLESGKKAVSEEVAKASDDRKRRGRFHVFRADKAAQTALSTVHEPLVEGLLNQNTFALTYGKPGAAKTFNLIDMGFCIAMGKPWAGQYATSKGAVFYIAAEGGTGILQRVAAAAKHHGAGDDTPFYLLPAAVDFVSSNEDVKAIAKLAKEAAARSNAKLLLIVVDTVNRAMGGRDENSAVDMGAFIRNVDLLRELTGAAVIAVHHTGKDESKGARGHSSLLGALDTEIFVRGDGTIETTKQRDLPELETVARFVLMDVSIGADPSGRELKSAAVVYGALDEFAEEMPLEPNEQLVLDAFVIAAERSETEGRHGILSWPEWMIAVNRAREAGGLEAWGERSIRNYAQAVVGAGWVKKHQKGAYQLARKRKKQE